MFLQCLAFLFVVSVVGNEQGGIYNAILKYNNGTTITQSGQGGYDWGSKDVLVIMLNVTEQGKGDGFLLIFNPCYSVGCTDKMPPSLGQFRMIDANTMFAPAFNPREGYAATPAFSLGSQTQGGPEINCTITKNAASDTIDGIFEQVDMVHWEIPPSEALDGTTKPPPILPVLAKLTVEFKAIPNLL